MMASGEVFRNREESMAKGVAHGLIFSPVGIWNKGEFLGRFSQAERTQTREMHIRKF